MKDKKIFLIALFLLCLSNASAQEKQSQAEIINTHQLMPVPMSMRFMQGRLSIDSSFTFAVKGHDDARLQGGIERALKRLRERTGLDIARNAAIDPVAANLVIECRTAGETIQSVSEDESYSLEVSDKQAVLSAPTVVGALHGLETFLQLLEGDRSGYYIPFASIQDKPRFPWRGLLIDVCRHWQPLEVIKRNLDGMASVKLNVLHLHLTENQGFRIESRKFPKLHGMGSDGLYYTQNEIREIIAYARDRGIRVIPEFDIPGHSTAWFVGYPELASAPGPYQIERKYGVFDPAMNPTREETYKFLNTFLGEMSALFPDAYLHIGGDEVTGKHWRLNPQIQAFMSRNGLKDKQALQAYFNVRVSRILQKHGKKIVGWDEILHPDLPKDIVIQSWRGQKSLAEGARKGYTGILSSGYYLDHLLPAATLYTVDPIRSDSGLTAQEEARILGGEACMWGEYVSQENIDARIWPRMAAIAERFWSPRNITNVDDMYRRLAVVSAQLEELGLTHEAYRDRMLRRMAGGSADEGFRQLEILANVVEPLKFNKRENIHPITQLTPLTRLVDAAGADSRTAREFTAMVEALLSDAPRFRVDRDGIRDALFEWQRVHPAIYVLADKSPVLRDAEQVAKDLAEISAIGLEALQYLTAGVAPPAAWHDEKLIVIARVAKSKAEVEFPMLPSIKQLVIAATEAPQLSSMSPFDWKTRVKTLSVNKK